MTDAQIHVQPVILCGGSGTRLWPLSRMGFPKQFLAISGRDSLFQLAAKRLAEVNAGDLRISGPLIVSNEEHRFLIMEQLREIRIEPAALLLEPCAKNTAPALTLAALAANENGDDPVLVVMPADQIIPDQAAFAEVMQKAVRSAAVGGIAMLGIVPQRPETGYGYIRVCGDVEQLIVERFVEKPDLETACQYVASGNYYWNSGIFVLRASVWLAALRRLRADISDTVSAAWTERSEDVKFVRPDARLFAIVPADSVDYAVMERCSGLDVTVSMFRLNAGWNDLGTWEAVWQNAAKDGDGNALHGDAVAYDCQNTFVRAETRLVGTVGLRDMLVVETADAVLVVSRSSAQNVKQIVSALDGMQRAEHLLHRKVHRPWGWYDSIDEGDRFKVKRILVNPRSSLSLQKHLHRAEHWVVVRGTAEIVCGDRTILLTENQSTYIPLGEVHRLSNPGTIPLEIIEIQSGSYLGEDDIIRFDDAYGRGRVET